MTDVSPLPSNRLDKRFADLKAANRSAFVTFVTAGDPDPQTSAQILSALPAAGADIIEIGMPFSDPSADGPTIDKASQRALANGMTLVKSLEMLRTFRVSDKDTPIVLMGYFNPLLAFGIEKFCEAAFDAGADGLIIVDLPPEEDAELRLPANKAGLHLVRLATPTSTGDRLPTIIEGASGFIYYVAVAGITGQKSADSDDIAEAVARLKASTELPIAVGFGIRTPEAARAVAENADGTVVGSAIVSLIEEGAQANMPAEAIVKSVSDFVTKLAEGVRSAR